MPSEIGSIETEKYSNGEYKSVHINFGPHYFVRLDHESENGRIRFVLGATHHGFQADASDIGGELETFVNRIRKLYPENTVD